MNTLKRFVWIGLAVALAASSSAWAQDIAPDGVGDQYRLTAIRAQPGFSPNYIKDTTIMCPWNLRAEFSGTGWHAFERTNYNNFDFLMSISLIEGLEVGADMPLVLIQPEDPYPDSKGIGDVSAYIKYRILHTDMLDLVGGFEYQANSADNDTAPCGATAANGGLCTLGFGERGYNPFGSVRVRLGDQFATGGHFGVEFFEDPLGDVANWDVNAIWTPFLWLSARLELTGYNQITGPSQDIIALQPGIDFVFDRMTFRIGGTKGLTDDAADWNLGGGLAITFGEKCAEEAPPPTPAPAPAVVAPPPPPAKKRIVLRGVNFDFNKSNIRPVDVPVLEEAVKTLKEENLPAVVAIGYTDSIGTEAYNLKLSDRRADSVKSWLVAHGIPADKITAEGRGEADPVASNETADGRAQNRRVELKIRE